MLTAGAGGWPGHWSRFATEPISTTWLLITGTNRTAGFARRLCRWSVGRPGGGAAAHPVRRNAFLRRDRARGWIARRGARGGTREWDEPDRDRDSLPPGREQERRTRWIRRGALAETVSAEPRAVEQGVALRCS